MERYVPWLILACTALAGCARRDAPYRFRAPIVAGYEPRRLAPPERPRPATRPRARKPRPSRAAATTPGPVHPRLQPIALGDSLADRLRALVGGRDTEQSHVEFAIAAVRVVGFDPDRALAETRDGPSLLALAHDRGAFHRSGTPVLGDLVVFDRVIAREPASLVGVVISARPDGTVEFIYLQRGVIRRGWVNPRRPRDQRDRTGRILNTLIRGTDGRDPRGTEYLAGALFHGYLRTERLTAARVVKSVDTRHLK